MYFKIKKYDEGLTLYNSVLLNFTKCLGVGHTKTAEVIMEITKAHLNKNNYHESYKKLKKVR